MKLHRKQFTTLALAALATGVPGSATARVVTCLRCSFMGSPSVML